MIVHITPQLQKKIPKTKQKAMSIEDNPMGEWQANHIQIRNVESVLFVHINTRWPVLLTQVKKSDWSRLNSLFKDVFLNSLRDSKIPENYIEKLIPFLTPLSFDEDCERSVQTTLNQMTIEYKTIDESENTKLEGLDKYSTSVRLANRPCAIKGFKKQIFPLDAMTQFLKFL
jgi:hypothetical protein